VTLVAYRIFVGTPKGERLLERPRCRSKNNIKINLEEVECGVIDWIDISLDRIPVEGFT
jgi:hypothetical protein